MYGTHVNDFIDEWCWEVVFGTSQIQIAKVHTNVDGALFFVYGDRVGNLSGVCDGIDETDCVQFLDFCFDRCIFLGMHGSLHIMDECHARPGIDMVFNNG